MEDDIFNQDFYPTPRNLIEKMVSGLEFKEIDTILEPSAGKGDICDYINDIYENRHNRRFNIDVIELVTDLQSILKSKEYNLVFDDFLRFETNKVYDLILANFPFSDGDKHLYKAIDLQEKNGGAIVCLVNAETIRNPFSNLRKLIVQKLEEYGATIDYLQEEFVGAERKTSVEVALIKVNIQKKKSTLVLDSIKKEQNIDVQENFETQVIAKDFIKSLMARFNFECKLGIKIIDEYFILKPHIQDSIKTKEKDYSRPIIELKVSNAYEAHSSFVNSYVEEVRHKYWEVLLRNENFRKRYTSNLIQELEAKLNELRKCDFNEFNVHELEKELNRNMTAGIENTILKLFDDFSNKHSFSEEFGKNIHYFNGWKTNKAYKINKKVILPIFGFSSYSWKQEALEYHARERMEDMVKVFNFLGNELQETRELIGSAVQKANTAQNFRDINFHYFTATFFKKGTCHIKFIDEKLLNKFNIYGSQRKGWLPPSYGKKSYQEMDQEEKQVVDDFQGQEEYSKIVSDKDYYIVENKKLLLSL